MKEPFKRLFLFTDICYILKAMKLSVSKRVIKIFVLISLVVLPIVGKTVEAQIQDGEFSGSSKSSYQCFTENGDIVEPTDRKDSSGRFLCACLDGSLPLNGTGICAGKSISECSGVPGSPGCPAAKATLIPPTLQQIEFWFVRIIYVIWTLVASFSVFYLLVLGYQYMLTRGDVTKITEIRQKIIYYIIGFALVFLAIPILTTVFRVLGVNSQAECYNVNLDEIGFQFFFSELCTAPTFVDDPCDYIDNFGSPVGKVCNTALQYTCTEEGASVIYRCTDGVWTDVNVPVDR
ncbi:hypothetical protein KC669_04025 [Candidatus Dojkabacteria bacterium]|uniref:Uncharacterized protein n=1 Tax=Candidatus Dojkabacteria bacterium TaxID=2099670 RepID=A0A955RLK5_9BACT|nr:hypothetical protein [Candidatus Dojkabacteria bacterium]